MKVLKVTKTRRQLGGSHIAEDDEVCKRLRILSNVNWRTEIAEDEEVEEVALFRLLQEEEEEDFAVRFT